MCATQGKSVTINVHVVLLMTTDIERKIRFDVEGLGSYLIAIKLVGELSTKLDPDDIDMIQPPIGQGSFGTVFKANYRGQEVAAKLLNSQMDKRLIAEFHRCATTSPATLTPANATRHQPP
jgi:hypothetical protein